MSFWDTHFHVFTPSLPMVSDRRYAPDYEASPEAHKALMEKAGLGSGIIIQPSFLGTDNSYMLEAIKAMPESLKGVAVVDPAVSLAELQELKAGGIVGIRFNLVGKTIPDFSNAVYATLFSHVRRLGWHVEIHREAKDLPLFLPVLINSGIRIVIDHFGLPDPADPLADPGFTYLLGLGKCKQIWVKISAPYRTQKEDMGLPFAKEAAPKLIRAFGAENILWGSDWPHTRFEQVIDYASMFASFTEYVPDADSRRIILEEAPKGLMQAEAY